MSNSPFYSLRKSLEHFMLAYPDKEPNVILHTSCVSEPSEEIKKMTEFSDKIHFHITNDAYHELNLLRFHASLPGVKRSAEKLFDWLRNNRLSANFRDLYGYIAKASATKDHPWIFAFYDAKAAAEMIENVAKTSNCDNMYILYFDVRYTDAADGISYMYPTPAPLMNFFSCSHRENGKLLKKPFVESSEEVPLPDKNDNRIKCLKETELLLEYVNSTEMIDHTLYGKKTDTVRLGEKKHSNNTLQTYIFEVIDRPDIMAKLFLQDNLPEILVEKFRELAYYNGAFGNRIIFPEALIIDPASKKCIGFTMKKLDDARDLHACKSDENCEPQKIYILKQIAALLLELRLLGIEVLDISLGNFIVDKKFNVSMIDTDSVETMRCTHRHGTDPFRHRNMIAMSEENWFRDRKYIDFSFAVLVFFFYESFSPLLQKFGDSTPSWLKFQFPFEVSGSDRVSPDCLNAWLELPENVRSAFVDVFNENKIYSIGQWIELFDYFR